MIHVQYAIMEIMNKGVKVVRLREKFERETVMEQALDKSGSWCNPRWLISWTRIGFVRFRQKNTVEALMKKGHERSSSVINPRWRNS